MMKYFVNFRKYLPLLFLSIVFMSCSTTEPAIDNPTVELEQQSNLSLERPIPYPIDIPNVFLNAIEEGTRTADGHPGPTYWQNEASYDLYAELDPVNHIIYGSATVTYQNNSPDNLDVIVLE
ncbi:MAG: hypothetical protein WDZ80_02150, partial [Candidatus Paceibacterota bacterium]